MFLTGLTHKCGHATGPHPYAHQQDPEGFVSSRLESLLITLGPWVAWYPNACAWRYSAVQLRKRLRIPEAVSLGSGYRELQAVFTFIVTQYEDIDYRFFCSIDEEFVVGRDLQEVAPPRMAITNPAGSESEIEAARKLKR